MRITSSGNVGIGNTSPSDFLSWQKQLVVGSGSADVGITIYHGSGSGNQGAIVFADGNTGTDRYRGSISYTGADEMKFFTSTIERMRITSGGNVGIGLTNPGEKFVVSGNSARIKIQTASDPSAYYTYLESNYDGSNSFNIVDGGLHKFGSKALVTHNDTYINSYYNVYIATGTTTNSSASNIRLFVNSTGNVGIGTTSPIQKT